MPRRDTASVVHQSPSSSIEILHDERSSLSHPLPENFARQESAFPPATATAKEESLSAGSSRDESTSVPSGEMQEGRTAEAALNGSPSFSPLQREEPEGASSRTYQITGRAGSPRDDRDPDSDQTEQPGETSGEPEVIPLRATFRTLEKKERESERGVRPRGEHMLERDREPAVVKISIGRIEVKAISNPPVIANNIPARAPSMTLENYLKAKGG